MKETQQVTDPETTKQWATNTQYIKVILAFPTSKIVLKIEETTPLDVFCNPTHKVVVKRQRKKRKLNTMTIATLEN